MKKALLITLLMFTTFVGFADNLALTNLIVETSVIPNGGSGPYVRHDVNSIAFSFHHNDILARNISYVLTIDGINIQRGPISLSQETQGDQTVTGLTGYTFTKPYTPVTICLLYSEGDDNEIEETCATYTVTAPNPPLPVELVTFTGVGDKGSVTLSWATAIECDFNYFSVQKSTNGTDFVTIGAVKAIGSGTSYKYKTPSEGEAYFRLRMVDNDASFKFSPIVYVNTDEAVFSIETFDFNGRKIPSDSHKQGFMIIVKTKPNGQRTSSKVFIQ